MITIYGMEMRWTGLDCTGRDLQALKLIFACTIPGSTTVQFCEAAEDARAFDIRCENTVGHSIQIITIVQRE